MRVYFKCFSENYYNQIYFTAIDYFNNHFTPPPLPPPLSLQMVIFGILISIILQIYNLRLILCHASMKIGRSVINGHMCLRSGIIFRNLQVLPANFYQFNNNYLLFPAMFDETYLQYSHCLLNKHW